METVSQTRMFIYGSLRKGKVFYTITIFFFLVAELTLEEVKPVSSVVLMLVDVEVCFENFSPKYCQKLLFFHLPSQETFY